MNTFDEFKIVIAKIIQDQFELNHEVLELIEIVTPKIHSHGDLSTNIAMILGQHLSIDSITIAAKLSNSLNNLQYIDQVEVIEPGFINLFLKPSYWQNLLKIILELDYNYGISNVGQNQNLTLHYLSPHPYDSKEINHLRGITYQNILASLFTKTGYNVTCNYLANDLINIENTLRSCQQDKSIFILNISPIKFSKLKYLSQSFIIKTCQPFKIKEDILRLFHTQDHIDQSYGNPIFSVQYAQTRINSLFNMAKELTPLSWSIFENNNYNLSLLTHQNDLDLIQDLAIWPKIARNVITNYEPYQINLYLEKLSTLFHSLWIKARESQNFSFIIKEDPELTAARLALIKALQNVTLNGLNILGINIKL